MTYEAIMREAQELNEKAKDINSLGEAQEAVKKISRLIFYLAKSLKKPEEFK
jgi:hypothetical protein